jgi:peptidoglycan/xylan/chitin deacetylase (PgdA/CDA1 family)
MAEVALVRVHLDAAKLPASARWADGLQVSLPASLAEQMAGGVLPVSATSCDGESATDLRDRRAYLHQPPASGRLPVSYRSVPGPLRRGIANVMGRVLRLRQQSWADFPGWPLDLSADVLADLAGASTLRVEAPTPVLLTHDIDSPEGLENLVRLFLPIEEEAGARSANYIVPCAWPLDEGLLRETVARGHEIGIHGYDHSNRTSFASPGERRQRLAAGHVIAKRYGAIGYRAPSLVRSRALLADLDGLYRYDSSIPTSGGPFPVANNGCASARPWRIGGLWEIPLSLPRDGSLRFLGHKPEAIARMWIEAADLIAKSGGVVTLLTHCERGFSGNVAMLDAYRRFLAAIAADGRFHFVLPRDLVQQLDGLAQRAPVGSVADGRKH